MDFEWDGTKRQANLVKHGVDLLFAAGIFDAPVLTLVDGRYDYGETRYISLGLIDDIPYVVVHTPRGVRTRLISAWQGGREDYVRYKDNFA